MKIKLFLLISFWSVPVLTTEEVQKSAATTESTIIRPQQNVEGKFVPRPLLFRPFAPLRRPIRPIIRRPPVILAAPVEPSVSQYDANQAASAPNPPTYSAQLPQTTQIARPVIYRRPILRPFRPIVRPLVRPPLRRPIAVHRPVQVVYAAPAVTQAPQRLPDIELRDNEGKREVYKRTIKRILGSGAKLALQAIQMNQMNKTDLVAIKKSIPNVKLKDIVTGAEVVLKRYIELKKQQEHSNQIKRRSDNTHFSQMPLREAKLNHNSTPPPSSSTTRPIRKSQSAMGNASTKGKSKDKVRTNSKTPSKETSDTRASVPDLLAPWSSSNLVKLLKNVHSLTQKAQKKPSDKIEWRPANVSLVDAKIVNDTKGRRITYIPSAWYMEDAGGSTEEEPDVKPMKLETTTLAASSTSRAQVDDESGDTVTSSSEEIRPISTEHTDLAYGLTESSEEDEEEAVTQPTTKSTTKHTRRPTTTTTRATTTRKRKPHTTTTRPDLVLNDSSEPIPVWIMQGQQQHVKRPTQFGFGHSVLMNNHKAPSLSHKWKLPLTTTTPKPKLSASKTKRPQSAIQSLLDVNSSSQEGSSETSVLDPLIGGLWTTSRPTTQYHPLSVIDGGDFNTTIVHQNIITIAKPTRPFSKPHKTNKPNDADHMKQSKPSSNHSKPSTSSHPKPSSSSSSTQSRPTSSGSSKPFASHLKPSGSSHNSKPSNTTNKVKTSSSKKTSQTKPSQDFATAESSVKPVKTSSKKKKPTADPDIISEKVQTEVATITTTRAPWTPNKEPQFANAPIADVPPFLNPFASLIQMIPNSLFRMLQAIGGFFFALPSALIASLIAAMFLI